MGECLAQRGWDVEYVGNGGFSVETPPEQLEVYRADDAECAEAAGVGTTQAAPITPALAESEYAAQQGLRACLVELGLIPPELPTYQVFSDALFERAEAIDLYGLAPIAATPMSMIRSCVAPAQIRWTPGETTDSRSDARCTDLKSFEPQMSGFCRIRHIHGEGAMAVPAQGPR